VEGLLSFSLVMVIIFLPTTLLIEVGHWLTHSQIIRHPVIKCLVAGTAVGVIFILFQIHSAHGEQGLVMVAVAPWILLVFSLAGFSLGFAYRKRGKPLFVRRPKRSVG
jgi:hypothetical protein